MVGYQETLTDPSYCGQIVTQTFPLIGNYGLNDEDYESRGSVVSGYIVREYCDAPSNFRCAGTLDETMKKYGIAGIYGVDTRQITRHIRDKGSCEALITSADNDTGEAVRSLMDWVCAWTSHTSCCDLIWA